MTDADAKLNAAPSLPFEQSHSVLVLICVMILGGILGSYCRQVFDGTHKNCSWVEIVIPGLVASFVVPLFLSIGKSDILTAIVAAEKDFYPNLFIVFAFCLLAAVTARNFVDALSREALMKATLADAKATHASVRAEAAETNAVEAKDIASESIEESENKSNPIPNSQPQPDSFYLDKADSENERAVIRALLRRPNARRAATSIAQEEGISRSGCLLAIISLMQKGVIAGTRSSHSNNILYKLT